MMASSNQDFHCPTYDAVKQKLSKFMYAGEQLHRIIKLYCALLRLLHFCLHIVISWSKIHFCNVECLYEKNSLLNHSDTCRNKPLRLKAKHKYKPVHWRDRIINDSDKDYFLVFNIPVPRLDLYAPLEKLPWVRSDADFNFTWQIVRYDHSIFTKRTGLINGDTDKEIIDDDTCKEKTNDDTGKQITDNDTCKQIKDNDTCKQIKDNDTYIEKANDDTCKQISDNDTITCKQITDCDKCKQTTCDDACKEKTHDDTGKETPESKTRGSETIDTVKSTTDKSKCLKVCLEESLEHGDCLVHWQMGAVSLDSGVKHLNNMSKSKLDVDYIRYSIDHVTRNALASGHRRNVEDRSSFLETLKLLLEKSRKKERKEKVLNPQPDDDVDVIRELTERPVVERAVPPNTTTVFMLPGPLVKSNAETVHRNFVEPSIEADGHATYEPQIDGETAIASSLPASHGHASNIKDAENKINSHNCVSVPKTPQQPTDRSESIQTNGARQLSETSMNQQTVQTNRVQQISEFSRNQQTTQTNTTHIPDYSNIDGILKEMGRGKEISPKQSMKFELLRLCTLRNFPKENKPFLIRFAAAGFYYAAEEDEVVCYCCGIRRKNWTANCDPMAIHKRLSPHCSFFNRNAEVNTPVPRDVASPGPDKFANLRELLETPPPEIGNDTALATRNNTASSTTNVTAYEKHPKHPHYAVKQVRLNSYVGWPTDSQQTPEILAEAGFYYAGMGDCVRCFHCGVGLRHWAADDNPWIEHGRWTLDTPCYYLIQIKGEEFLSLIRMAVEITDSQPPKPGSNQPQGASKNTNGSGKTTDNKKGANKKGGSKHSKKQQKGKPQAEKKQLKEENERLRKQTLCKVCEERDVCIVFLPCGHLVTCAECAPTLSICSTCKSPVKGTVKTYMS